MDGPASLGTKWNRSVKVCHEGGIGDLEVNLDREKFKKTSVKIADFCRRHHIRKLALFGSVLRDDFCPESDVDVLIELEPGAAAGFLRLVAMELELSKILGRRVDLRTPAELSRYFRDEVLKIAKEDLPSLIAEMEKIVLPGR